jgi:nucleotide-binding universal stress UspA family protein
MANPGLHADDKANLVRRLMAARRAVRDAKASSDRDAEVTAHHVVDEAKRALGERGAVWWDAKDQATKEVNDWYGRQKW